MQRIANKKQRWTGKKWLQCLCDMITFIDVSSRSGCPFNTAFSILKYPSISIFLYLCTPSFPFPQLFSCLVLVSSSYIVFDILFILSYVYYCCPCIVCVHTTVSLIFCNVSTSRSCLRSWFHI